VPTAYGCETGKDPRNFGCISVIDVLTRRDIALWAPVSKYSNAEGKMTEGFDTMTLDANHGTEVVEQSPICASQATNPIFVRELRIKLPILAATAAVEHVLSPKECIDISMVSCFISIVLPEEPRTILEDVSRQR
jgi:hypothetical protein